MNPIVFHCISNISCCVVCDVVVAAVADESGWCNILSIRFAVYLLLQRVGSLVASHDETAASQCRYSTRW